MKTNFTISRQNICEVEDTLSAVRFQSNYDTKSICNVVHVMRSKVVITHFHWLACIFKVQTEALLFNNCSCYDPMRHKSVKGAVTDMSPTQRIDQLL